MKQANAELDTSAASPSSLPAPPAPAKVTRTQQLAPGANPAAGPSAAPAPPGQQAQIAHDTAAAFGFLGGPAATVDDSMAAAAAAAASDPAIDALDLDSATRTAAYAVKAAFPAAVFTSGRRTTAEQAHAMATNIVEKNNRNWIGGTYFDCAPVRKLQKWVDDHPQATTTAALAAGLQAVLDGMSAAHQKAISRHLVGRAFDVRPTGVAANEQAVKAEVEQHGGEFIPKEDGLVRWHAEF